MARHIHESVADARRRMGEWLPMQRGAGIPVGASLDGLDAKAGNSVERGCYVEVRGFDNPHAAKRAAESMRSWAVDIVRDAPSDWEATSRGVSESVFVANIALSFTFGPDILRSGYPQSHYIAAQGFGSLNDAKTLGEALLTGIVRADGVAIEESDCERCGESYRFAREIKPSTGEMDNLFVCWDCYSVALGGSAA